MQRSSRSGLVLALSIAVTTGVSGSALAYDVIDNPYGNSATIIVIATRTNHDGPVYPMAVFQRQSDGECTHFQLGTAQGLNQEYLINSGNGNDIITEPKSAGSISCTNTGFGTIWGTIPVSPLLYNGNVLDVDARGGDDTIACLNGDTYCWGGDQNDVMLNYSAIGRLHGGDGNDRLLGSSAISSDWLQGDEHNDCLDDPGDSHSKFDCGNGSDSYISPGGTGRISCEAAVSSCP